jgi:hypothetical protein
MESYSPEALLYSLESEPTGKSEQLKALRIAHWARESAAGAGCVLVPTELSPDSWRVCSPFLSCAFPH